MSTSVRLVGCVACRFVWSADLHHETSLLPWSVTSSVPKDEVKRVVSFFHKHGGGTGDFVLLWDGRDPKSRRHIEDELDVLNSGSTATEFSVHYTTDLTKRPSAGRRVFGGAHYRETGWMKGTVARVNAFGCCGHLISRGQEPMSGIIMSILGFVGTRAIRALKFGLVHKPRYRYSAQLL